MEKTRFLIQASYGYSGVTHTGYVDIVFSGLSIWELEYDGTLRGEKEALTNAQLNSNYVKAFNEVCADRNLDSNMGRWLVFSVIDKD